MYGDLLRSSVAASLWVAATVLMAVATALASGPLVLAGWAVLLALGGSILIGWHLLAHERVRTEHIARIAAERTVEYSRLESVT